MSPTILLPNLYQSPKWKVDAEGKSLATDEEEKEALEEFYMDMWEELAKFGDVEQVYVCENLGEHLIGNVYVKYYNEDDAASAVVGLAGRFYAQRPIAPEFSPVTDFREGSCRQHVTHDCTRGGYCNFMHLAHTGRAMQKELQKTFNVKGHEEPDKGRSRSRSRSKSRSRERRRRRSRSRSRDRDRGRDRDRRRSRSRSRDRKRRSRSRSR